MSETESIWDVPLVVSCYEGVQHVGPLPPTVRSWYTVLKDGSDFFPDLPRLVASDALAWGYNGSGPLALAFALLADEFGEPIAWLYCRAYCDQVTAVLPQAARADTDTFREHLMWTLTSRDLRAWMLAAPLPDVVDGDVAIDAWEWTGPATLEARVAAEFYPGRRVAVRLTHDVDDESNRGPVVAWMEVQRWRMWNGFGDGGWEAEPPGAGPVPPVRWTKVFPKRRRWTADAGA